MLIPAVDWKALWGKRAFRTAVIGLCSAFALSGVGVAGYYLWPEPAPEPPPPAETATTQEAREYMASDDFNRLPLDQRSEWAGQTMRRVAQMDDAARRDLWESTGEETRDRIRENMRQMMTERWNRDVETYHSLPASEREAFIDKKIDEMRSRGRGGWGMGRGPRGDRPPRREGQARSNDRGRRAEASRGGPGDRDRRSGDRGRGSGRYRGRRGGGGPGGRLARMPADKRGEYLVYRKAMAKRLAERGLGPPGGRGR